LVACCRCSFVPTQPSRGQRPDDPIQEVVPRGTVILESRFGEDDARSDAVDPDPALDPFRGQRDGHVLDGGPGGRGMHHSRHPVPIADGDVDDRSPAGAAPVFAIAVAHVPVVDLLAQEEGPVQVRLDDGREPPPADFARFREELSPRIVDQHVDGTVPVQDVVHEPDDVLLVPEVGGWTGHDPPGGGAAMMTPSRDVDVAAAAAAVAAVSAFDFAVDFVGRLPTLRFGPTGNHDGRTEGGQFTGDRPADARAAPGDEGDLPPKQVASEAAPPGSGAVGSGWCWCYC
jgi:hypothetical protein